MNPSIQETNHRIKQLRDEVQKRGAERYSSTYHDINALPPELKSSKINQLVNNDEIKVIIYFPAQIQRGWQYVPKQALIFTKDKVVHLLASIWPEAEPQITSINNGDLLFIEITLILLYGLIKIEAINQENISIIEVEFNTVDWSRLSGPMYAMLHSKYIDSKLMEKEEQQRNIVLTQNELRIKGIKLEASPEPFFPRRGAGYWIQKRIKITNGIRLYGLLPNETLNGVIFQPEYWEARFFFFRKQLIANTMVLRTTNYLIIMKEELNVGQGWIIAYIPWKNIKNINQRQKGIWQEIEIMIEHNEKSDGYKLLISNEVAKEWRNDWVRFGVEWILGEGEEIVK
jgi:hypothetical protein